MPAPGGGCGVAALPSLPHYCLSSTNLSCRPVPAHFQEIQMPTTVSPRILIVDDEVEITEILADLLSEDYECLKAGSAEDAIARLNESEFHLVISDITMPGMSGLDMIPH